MLILTTITKISKTDAEWRDRLSTVSYAVTRHKATEPPFSARYWNHKAAGIYRCVCCGTKLFASDTKFDSGCGWPSYFGTLFQLSSGSYFPAPIEWGVAVLVIGYALIVLTLGVRFLPLFENKEH